MQKVIKKLIPLSFLLLLFCTTAVVAQSCLPGYIYWTTQAEIDSFQIKNPGCIQIEGNLFIKGNDITNLNGLSVLTAIDGYLEIKGNPLLTSLSGLENLNYIGGNLIIGDFNYGNPLLLNLSGLNNLTSIGEYFSITNNDVLEDITDLGELTIIGGGLGINNNLALENLTGLDNITSIGGELSIRNNPLLINLAGMDQLTNVGGGIIIWYSPFLTSLSGLENLSSIGDGLYIRDNENLTDISALDGLTNIGGSLDFYNNNSLSSLNGLENVPSVGGGLSIVRNTSLSSLEGLGGIKSVGGNLKIGEYSNGDNPALTSLTGLEGLNYVGGTMIVKGNSALLSLTGIENLDSIRQSLWIGKNIQLENLSALANLTSVGSEIAIDSNLALTSLSGLDNISPSPIVALYIYDNPLLTECEVKSICDYLAGTPGYVYIINNAIGCNNQDEVEEACESAGIPDFPEEGSISIYPNPAHSEITISGLDKTTIEEVNIYNRLGQRVIHQKGAETKINVLSLLPGMYLVEVVLEGIKLRKKLVIR